MNMSKSFKRVVLIALLVLPFLVYFTMVYTAEDNFFVPLDYVGPKEVKQVTDAGNTRFDTTNYIVPQWEFTTQDDTLLSSDDLKGKIYVANFFFATCPSICPAMNFNVKQVQDRFKGFENFRIASFTVDPEHDTAEVLKAYERTMGAEPGIWYFLTGDKNAIYKTAGDYFQSAMPDSLADGGFLHSENLVLVDWEGHIRSRRDDNGNLKAVYNGLSPVEINDLKDDIKVLIAEYEKKRSADEHKASKEKKKNKR